MLKTMKMGMMKKAARIRIRNYWSWKCMTARTIVHFIWGKFRDQIIVKITQKVTKKKKLAESINPARCCGTLALVSIWQFRLIEPTVLLSNLEILVYIRRISNIEYLPHIHSTNLFYYTSVAISWICHLVNKLLVYVRVIIVVA